ncbi:MAG: hypothetical protein U0359_34665 [Byssovorax sp.]
MASLALALFASGCSGAGAPEDPSPPGFSELVAADWSLPPGGEAHLCALQTIPEERFISAFRAVAPPGTHHALLTVTEPTGADGTFACDAGALSDAMIFGSGIATPELTFPEGVAMRIPAGRQALLNLHLLNTGEGTLTGRSAVLARDAAEDAIEAEMIFAGTVDIDIPPGAEVTRTGHCTFDSDATVFDLWPHMHRYGRHMTVTHRTIQGSTILHDGPYAFEEQLHHPITPVLVRRGESIEVTCTWANTGPDEVRYGDSSLDEMCFAGIYRYPAAHAGLFCASGP